MFLGETIALAGARAVSPSWKRPHWRVIYFHGVEKQWVARFAEYLDHFSETFAWRPFSVALAQARSGTMDRPCMSLTFDDADRSVYENALPMLEERRIPACIFVVPQYVESGQTLRDSINRPVMSWKELADWVTAGMEVGNHTYSHQNLRMLDEQSIIEEVSRAKSVLEDRLGVPVTDFAYPYGQFDRRTLAIIDTIPGIRCQVTTFRGPMLPRRDYAFIRRDRCDLFRTPTQAETIMRLADRFYFLRRLRRLTGP